VTAAWALAGAVHAGHAHHAGDAGPLAYLPVLAVAVAAAGYAAGVVRLRGRGDGWPRARVAAAAAGFATVAAAVVPPPAGERFPAEVTRHLLLAMAGPLALALAAPVTLALRTAPSRLRRRLLAVLHSRPARLVTRAPVVLLLAVGGTYAYYLTPLHGAAGHRPWLHAAVHGHMFLAGCLLSWYLAGRDPLPRRPPARVALLVLLVAAGSHDVLAKLMYAHGLPAGAGPVADVRLGAQVMFYGGDAVTVALAAAVLSAWYARAGRTLAHARRRAGGTAQRAGGTSQRAGQVAWRWKPSA
jgi:putative membrane protein